MRRSGIAVPILSLALPLGLWLGWLVLAGVADQALADAVHLLRSPPH